MAKKKETYLLERIQLIVSLIIRATILVAILTAILNQRWMVLFVSSLAFILTFLPAIIEKRYRVYLPIEFEIIIVLFIYAALFLGEVHGYYTKYWWWDVVLHTGSGVALGFLGFLIVYELYYEKKITASPFLVALLSFCFAVAMGALWEIFEFSMDSFFGLNMQKSGLIDTMWDLIVDCLGAFFTSALGYFYIKNERAFLFQDLIKKFVCENPRMFKNESMAKKICK